MHYCRECADVVETDYHETSGGKVGHLSCATCGGKVEEIEMTMRDGLIEWLGSCDFSGYSTDALQAAYDALVGDDGPPDDRCGHADSIEDAHRQIDDIEAEHEA